MISIKKNKKTAKKVIKIASACLANIACKYNGTCSTRPALMTRRSDPSLFGKEFINLVCPEAFAGGLPTPREPCEGPINGKVVARSGKDYTEAFTIGAIGVVQLALAIGATEFIGRRGSPSCGVGAIHDGTFTGTLIPGDGILTALLKKYGINVRLL